MTPEIISDDLVHQLAVADRWVATQQWAQAVSAYGRLTACHPHHPDLHHLYGLALLENGNPIQALVQIDKAIELAPATAVFHRSRGDVLAALQRLPQARQAYETALEKDPHDLDALLQLGNLYHEIGHLAQAADCFNAILEQQPDHVKACSNLGKTLADQGRLRQAITWYDRAIEAVPDYAEARFNRSLAFLSLGRSERGWKEYEWRFRRRDARRTYPHRIDSPRWDGSRFDRQRLLIHCEQGFGDVLQFCRYLPMVQQLGGHLIFEAQAPLVPLLQQLAIGQVVPFSPQHPPRLAHDIHLPLMSLPVVLPRLLDVPFSPYLKAPQDRIGQWRPDACLQSVLKVALVWSGSRIDPRRSCCFDDLRELLAIPGIQFYGLQTGEARCQADAAEKGSNWISLGGRLCDFADTAAVLTHMDLVISIDTATAHLAGAMGKPVWILLPFPADWRWQTDGDTTAWYPTARLFRKQAGQSWRSLIRSVAGVLQQHLSAHSYALGKPAINTENENIARQLFFTGSARYAENDLDGAIADWQNACRLSPSMHEARFNLALACHRKSDLDSARHHYNQVIARKPDYAPAYNNLGDVYRQQEKFPEAELCFRKAIAVDPVGIDGRYNLGTLLLDQQRLKDARIMFEDVLQRQPDHVPAACNLGRVWYLNGELNQARRYFELALSGDPEHAESHLNLAIVDLTQGKWEKGWQHYEWRFVTADGKRYYPHRLQQPRWSGGDFNGRTLLVHSEQGIGDALQMARYLPMVKRRGGRVVFETRRSLMSLFKQLGGVDEWAEWSQSSPYPGKFDLYVPLSSLPLIFGTRPESVPNTVPYLHADASRIGKWAGRLTGAGPCIGLVWGGNDTYRNRACTLDDMAPLADVPGISWIGLQKGPAAQQAAPADGRRCWVDNWGQDFEDFSDTAAALTLLDLIITIDTSVAHLAGAMGKPVWLLLPKVADWRWMAHRSDSPWYPTMRLFRQNKSGQWSDVIRQVRHHLVRLIESRTGVSGDSA